MIEVSIRRAGAVLAALALSAVAVLPAHAAPSAPSAPFSQDAGVHTPLSATVSSSYWSMNWHWPGGPVEDPPVTVTVAGGTGPFTYEWQRVSGDPTAYATYRYNRTTNFNNYIPVGDWEPRTSVFRCLITDTSTSNMVYSPTVNVWIHVWGYSPPGDPPD